MKKIFLITALVTVFVLSAFSGVLDYIPANNKALVYVNNLAESYAELKTVPSFDLLLVSGVGLEGYAMMYSELLTSGFDIDPEIFWSSFETDIGFFIQEPSDNVYSTGIVFGPMKDVKTFYDDLNILVLETLRELQITFTPIFKGDYLILVQDDVFYKSSKLGVSIENKPFENGIYYEINSSDIKNTGYFYVKDNELVGKSTGSVNEDEVALSKKADKSDSQFLGAIYGNTSFLPKDLSRFSEYIKIFADYNLAESLLKSSSNAEINVGIESEEYETDADFYFFSMYLKIPSYIKINTESTVSDVLPILEENDAKYVNLGDNYIKFNVKTDGENDSQNISKDFYLWKDGNNIFISSMDKEAYNKALSGKEKVSDNKVFKYLSGKIGTADMSTLFINFSEIFKNIDYIAESFTDDNYGMLLNVNYLGEGRIETEFIIH